METSDIEKIMALSSIFNSQNQTKKPVSTENNVLEKTKRQISTLKNIIPYIKPEMRIGIFTVIKLMEIADFESKNSVISAQDSEGVFNFERDKFIDAAQKYLSPQEKQVFNTLYMLSQLKEINLFGR